MASADDARPVRDPASSEQGSDSISSELSDRGSNGVKRLAALARLSIPEAELPKLAAEFESIVAYVGKLDALDVSGTKDARPPVRNVLREDGEPHVKGKHTAKLAAQFPEREGDYLKVKQIISHD